MAYHPQMDGQTEWQNQTLECYLHLYCNFEQDDWAQWLPLAQLCYNSSTHSSTNLAPNQALMDFNPTLQIEVNKPPPEGEAPDATSRAQKIQDLRTSLEDNLAKSMARQKVQYDKTHKPQTFHIGDQVMLNAKNIRRLRPSKKIDDRYLGPFTIIGAWGKQAYKLDLPQQYGDIHPVFHVNLLEPYHEREGYFTRPGPEIIDNEQEWEVEAILAQRGQGRKTQYLVKWLGYPPSEN